MVLPFRWVLSGALPPVTCGGAEDMDMQRSGYVKKEKNACVHFKDGSGRGAAINAAAASEENRKVIQGEITGNLPNERPRNGEKRLRGKYAALIHVPWLGKAPCGYLLARSFSAAPGVNLIPLEAEI